MAPMRKEMVMPGPEREEGEIHEQAAPEALITGHGYILSIASIL